MRFYTTPHRYYCGIDLHARRMYICVLDAEGQIRVHRNGPPELLKSAALRAPDRRACSRGTNPAAGRLSLLTSGDVISVGPAVRGPRVRLYGP